MYKKFFKLNSAPFKLTPETACFFSEGNRKAILDALIYAVSNGDGISKVVGEVGSGKTFLSRLLAKSLAEKFEVLYILNPRLSADQILYAIAIELGLTVENAEDKVGLLQLLHNKLLENHQSNKQTVLLIDESQSIPLETLEEIRMLGNLETEQHKLLQIVLFGQPELDQNLKHHAVRQIRERIIHSFYLPRLNAAEVGRYLYFRMGKAGYQGVFPFSILAVRLITWKADGLIRRVNILAEKCLLSAYSRQTRKIGLIVTLRALFENGFVLKALFLMILLLVVGGQYLNWNFSQKQTIESIESKKVVEKVQKKPQIPQKVKKTQVITETKVKQTVIQSAKDLSPAKSLKPYIIRLLRLKLTEDQDINLVLTEMIPERLWDQVYFYTNKPLIYYAALGNFATYDQARKFISGLPVFLRKNQPYIIKKDKKLYNRKLLPLKFPIKMPEN